MNRQSEEKWFDSRLKLRNFPVEYTTQNHECFNTTQKITGGGVSNSQLPKKHRIKY